MLERKNIDRVFQENLKDLEIYPNKRVWNSIEVELSAKTPKPTIALWKKLSGVAVILVTLLTSGFFYFTANKVAPIVESQVSDTDSKFNENSNMPTLTPVFVQPTTELANNEVDEKPEIRKTEKPIFVKKPNNKVIVTDNDIASIYKTIENKYIVDKEDLLEELEKSESITARMERIPEPITNPNTVDKKWSVGPTIAPVFYNTLQNGSPISDALTDNTKTSDNALSVGVKINYQFSNKLFIQSGVNKVELAYNTQNVNALISASKTGLNNLNTNKPGVILSAVRGVPGEIKSNLNKSGINGELNQSIEYYELPLEMKYSVYDKKLGLNLVGGFSTLFLSGNSVSIINQNGTTDLGNANNLNSFNFSGNLGVDVDYRITKSWYFNVAPMFKYQFNTYSGSSGNFRPYYFGLYSGLNYKF